MDKYPPQLVWFDWWIKETVFRPCLQKFAASYYDRRARRKREVGDLRARFWRTDTSFAGDGQWLAVNGEAICGTRPWKVRHRAGAAGERALLIRSPAARAVQSVQLLGSSGEAEVSQGPGGLAVESPREKPCGCVFALKIR